MARIGTPDAIRTVSNIDTERLIEAIGSDDAQLIEQIRPAVCWAINASSPTYLPNTERGGAWDYIAEVATSRIHLDSPELSADDFNITGDEDETVVAPTIDIRAAVEAVIEIVRKEGGK